MVEVTFENEGEDAFKSKIYRAKITHQRIIDDNGQNTVILTDHKQNVVKKASPPRGRRSGTSPSKKNFHNIPLHVRLTQLVSH